MTKYRAHIHSIEGDIYFLELEKEGVSQWVTKKRESMPRRFPSLASAKDFAKRLGAEKIQIALNTPYDEMIGLATTS